MAHSSYFTAGIVTACLLLSGCGGLQTLASVTEEIDLYDLTPKSTYDDNLPRVDWQLVIELPEATSAVNSNRVALKPDPTSVKYYAKARRVDRAPNLVQNLLIESFENSNKIVAVGRQAIGLTADYNLKTELREFQAEYYDAVADGPRVHVQLNAKIVKEPEGLIVASRNFEFEQDVLSDDLPLIIRSFDEALGKVIKRSVVWTLITINDIAPQGPKS